MHFIYGLCDGNARAAQREYRARYPDRVTPSSQVFSRLLQRLTETGSFHKLKRERGIEGLMGEAMVATLVAGTWTT
ncbi:hypothetical protein J6590_099946 [Homalodisca vitripennis]|nr:hypothetical protein J6590_099946 [Homalodisca vitripennis]